MFAFALCFACVGSLFVGSSVEASALSEGRYLTQQETLELFGQSLDITYWNGTEYVQTTASYQRPAVCSSDISDYVHDGLNGLFYAFSSGSSINNPDYLSVQLQPQWTISDTFQLHCVLAVGLSVGSVASPPFPQPKWVWHVSGTRQVFETSSISGVLPLLSYNDGWIRSGLFVEVDYTSQTSFSASSIEGQFWGCLSEGAVGVFVGCPYVSSDSSVATGTITTTSATTSTSYEPGGDAGFLGSLLQAVISAILGLLDGLVGLFVPSVQVVQDFFAGLSDLIADLWPEFDFSTYEERILSCFESSTGSAVLRIPDISVPVGGGSYTILSGRVVDIFEHNPTFTLVNTSYTLQTFIKAFFNMLFTGKFVNVVLNKFRSIIAGGEVYVTSVGGDS